MAKIIFKNIVLKNFMSYADADIRLNHTGNILVGGLNNNPEDGAKSNGCGKSTIFNALVWCLTGETVNGATDVSNIYTNGKTEVTLDFTWDKDTYKITRTKNPSNLFIEINGENKSGKGIRDTSKLLAEYLPQLTSNLLNSVIILGQGLPQKFTGNTPAGRKDVLEKLSNSDFMILDLKERLKTRKDIITGQKTELEHDNTKHQTLIATKETDIKKLQQELSLMLDDDTLKASLNEAKQCQLNYINNIVELEQLLSEVNQKRTEFTAKRDEVNRKYVETLQNLPLESTTKFESEYNQLIGEMSALEREIRNLESVREFCPTCGQRLPDVHKIDTTEKHGELAEKKNKSIALKQTIQEIEQQNNIKKQECKLAFEKQLQELDSTLSALYMEKKTHDDAISVTTHKKENCDKQIISIETMLANYEKEKNYKLIRIEELQQEIKNSEQILYNNNEELEVINMRLSINSKMTNLIQRDFRGYLLNNVISFIQDRAQMYTFEVFGTDKLTFALSGNNINISYDGKDYSCLSGGEKQKLDVIIQFAIRDMLCTFLDFSSNLLVLDEITDALDSEGVSKIFNLISSHLQDVEALYIISHHVDELEIPADGEIKIIKGDDKISRII